MLGDRDETDYWPNLRPVLGRGTSALVGTSTRRGESRVGQHERETRLRLSRVCENAAGGRQVGITRARSSQTGARIFLAPVAETSIVE